MELKAFNRAKEIENEMDKLERLSDELSSFVGNIDEIRIDGNEDMVTLYGDQLNQDTIKLIKSGMVDGINKAIDNLKEEFKKL